MSSNSSTSTRSLTTKSSTSSTNFTPPTSSLQRASKRSLSPSIVISTEKPLQKRHQTRQQRQNMILSLSTTMIKTADNHENGIEQENDDDNDDDDDVIPVEVEPTKQSRQNKQRRASESSIEYVQKLNTDQQSTSSSLNNIENIKSTTKVDDEEIIICRSPPSTRKAISSPHKNHKRASMNGNSSRKSNIQQVLLFT